MNKGGSLDIQKLLSKLPFTTTGIPGEMHLGIPGITKIHNFVGPGTNLSIRLNPDDSPKDWSLPIDRDDEVAYRHDLNYRDAGEDLAKKHKADRIMLRMLNEITNPSLRERLDGLIIKGIINSKLKLGVGLSDKEKYADEIHKKFIKPKHLLKVEVDEKDFIWSADLVIMPS